MEDRAVRYASVWQRAIAFVIDAALFALVYFVLLTPLVTYLGLRSEKMPTETRWPFAVVVMSSFLASVALMILLDWLYFAIMQSSRKRATLGKLVVGIQVVGDDLSQLSFGQATGRYFSKFVSLFLLGAGFVMALFTPRKQALHDIMARTLVVEKR